MPAMPTADRAVSSAIALGPAVGKWLRAAIRDIADRTPSGIAANNGTKDSSADSGPSHPVAISSGESH